MHKRSLIVALAFTALAPVADARTPIPAEGHSDDADRATDVAAREDAPLPIIPDAERAALEAERREGRATWVPAAIVLPAALVAGACGVGLILDAMKPHTGSSGDLIHEIAGGLILALVGGVNLLVWPALLIEGLRVDVGARRKMKRWRPPPVVPVAGPGELGAGLAVRF